MTLSPLEFASDELEGIVSKMQEIGNFDSYLIKAERWAHIVAALLALEASRPQVARIFPSD